MSNFLLYPVGSTESCMKAAHYLKNSEVPLIDHPCPEITHILLDIPSFDNQGRLRDGSDLSELLRRLPDSVTVVGGNLKHRSIANYKTIDLLTDPVFLAKNAAITAECALQAAAPYLTTTYADTPTLILGWGRIGKCLTRLLSALGASVTVAARNPADRALLQAFGYQAVDFPQVQEMISQYRLVFNTVPELPFADDRLLRCQNCIIIDLASSPGMDGWDAVTARGLPGKFAPDTTGKLVAQTILRNIKEVSI